MMRCQGDKCTAVFPATASFCPRCGRANDQSAGPIRAVGKPRFKVWRMIVLLWIGSMVVRAVFHVSAVQPPVSSPMPMVTLPAADQDADRAFDQRADVGSLETFLQWRDNEAIGTRTELKRVVAGTEVRWIGTLKKSAWPGRFELLEDPSRGTAYMRILPVTADAKQDVRWIASGARIDVDGVLMDERSLHAVSVREVN